MLMKDRSSRMIWNTSPALDRSLTFKDTAKTASEEAQYPRCLLNQGGLNKRMTVSHVSLTARVSKTETDYCSQASAQTKQLGNAT